jgi:hypothetical protein
MARLNFLRAKSTRNFYRSFFYADFFSCEILRRRKKGRDSLQGSSHDRASGVRPNKALEPDTAAGDPSQSEAARHL